MKLRKNIPFWQIVLVGLVLISLRFLPSIIEGKILIFGDNYSLQIPGRVFTGYWLKQGIIPWWNPTIFAGIPWAHEMSQSVFYPTTIFFTFLNPGVAINFSVASHLLFTFFGMFLLVRLWVKNDTAALIGAILWTFSTQVTGMSNNLVTIQSIAWFPWISYWALMLFKSKRNLFIFSLSVLGQFLAGYPQHVVYAILLGVFLSAISPWKKITIFDWFKKWAITGFITLGVTAIVWLPFVDIFLQSTRTIQTTVQAGMGSLHPLMLIKLFLPYFFDNPMAGIKWGPAWSGLPNVALYITWSGLFLLFLAIKKRHSVFLLLFALVTILVSMGDNFFLFSLLQRFIPFFKVSRGPSIALICTNISLILIAMKEITEIKDLVIKNKILYLLLILSILSSLFVIALPKSFQSLWGKVDGMTHQKLSRSSFHTIDRDYVLSKNILINFSANLILLLFVLLAAKRQRVVIVAVLVGTDMLFNTQGMLFFAQRKTYPSWQEISKTIAAKPYQLSNPNYRSLTRNMNSSYTDFAMYWEAMTVREPFALSFVDEKELMSSSALIQMRDSYTPDWSMVYQVPMIHGYTTLLPKDFDALWATDNNPGINAIDKINIHSDLLRQWSVDNYIVDKQFGVDENFPKSTAVSLSNTVDLFTLPALPRFRYEDDSPVDITTLKENPNNRDLHIENVSHTALVLADRFDANWHAYINGKEVPISRHNGMMKISLQPGGNSIRYSYIPKAFFIGLMSTILFTLFSYVYFYRKQYD